MLFSTTVEMLDLIWAAYVQVSMNPYQCETDKDFFFSPNLLLALCDVSESGDPLYGYFRHMAISKNLC